MLYFDHDTSAGDDDKIVVLRDEHGGAAVDAYWTVLERIYKDETDLVFGKNQVQTKALTRRLGLGFEQLQTFVNAFLDIGLFEDIATDEQHSQGLSVLHSKRAAENIAAYRERKETARRNGSKGGRKPKRNRTLTKSVSDCFATANQEVTQPETNKRKVKEKKRSVEGDSTHHAQTSALPDTDHDSQIDPPTLEEVRSYFEANSLRGDPDAFFDFYESQGWRKSNGLPIASWTAQAKQWHRGQVERDAERAARGEPTPDEARWRPTANADPDADPRADAERAQEEYERAKARLTPEERRIYLRE